MFDSDTPINLDINNIDAMKEIERTLKQNQVKGTLYHFYCWRDLSDFHKNLDTTFKDTKDEMQLQRRDLDLHFILDKYILPQFESVQAVPISEQLLSSYKDLQPKLYQFGMEAKGDFEYCDVPNDIILNTIQEVEKNLKEELEELKQNQHKEPPKKQNDHHYDCCIIS
eukprot:TRINITY_DN346_c1_g1_i1.p1 TRINITY_DN346_c1_g1~~TRINITY_DN346_c1_g1_i1.p1  ORF type:complete len:168 (+),score=44.77 TRINITY_DN346_c1_g1_i1:57-560(+)